MTTAVETPGAARPQGARGLIDALEIDTRLLAMAAALVVIWVGLDLLTGGIFLTARNLWNLSVQTSVVGIMATGMVLVIVARHIDLSVGSVLGFVGMAMAVLQVEILPIGTSWNWLLSLVLGLVLGAAIGAFQGWWVAYRAVPAFIVTLGGLLIFRGLAWWITEGRTVAPMDPNFQLLGGGLDGSIGEFWSWVVGVLFIAAVVIKAFRTRQRRNRYNFPVRPLWAEALVLVVSVAVIVGFVQVMNSYYRPRTQIPQGIPIPVLILIVVAVGMSALTKVTKFGRYVFAIGGNPEAAELGGINVRKVTVMIFVMMGVLSAIAGAIQTARLNAGLNSTGSLLELSVIAAAVIGGTSLSGGVGTIAGAILGALIMQSLQSGMILLNISTPMQPVVIGLVLISAVWLDTVYQRRRR
ncbi:sugar ABC transporter permease [Skermanella aerolata]|uniref:Xylose transport system permease protein XylH n=1 Tax=Skermanella aerolata TaxID=393310 RepID=A0A512DIE0_9PROT|nr:sugar ABC transporter permease [Skermanella aerolata]KJB97537.1 sugar ABC transporter permease [Skermanella aerolata KACC 11604]GEO36237.1 sugar ABC transporter permease [Skermanella aerolata]